MGGATGKESEAKIGAGDGKVDDHDFYHNNDHDYHDNDHDLDDHDHDYHYPAGRITIPDNHKIYKSYHILW